MSFKLKDITSNIAIHCKNDEEKTQLWKWFNENGYVRKNVGTDSLIRFLSYDDDKNYTIGYGNSKEWLIADGSETVYEFTDVILDDNENSLSALEVLQICNEICKAFNCNTCPMSENCFCNKRTANYEKCVEICKQWRLDHAQKEIQLETEWVYTVYNQDNSKQYSFISEYEAILQCENMAECNTDMRYHYVKECRVKDVK